MGKKDEDAIFVDIKSRFGEDTVIAARYALRAILQPHKWHHGLTKDAASAALYLHRLITDNGKNEGDAKLDALLEIYGFLLKCESSNIPVPRFGVTLLINMVSRDKIAAGIIVSFGNFDAERVADNCCAGTDNDESDDVTDDDAAESVCVYSSGTPSDDYHVGDLLPVSKNCLRAAAELAASILDSQQWEDFRKSLKLIPWAALRATTASADTKAIACYTSMGVSHLREARLRPIFDAAARGDYEAVRAVRALEARTDIDRALIALMLPIVYRAGTLARLVRLDTLALARVLASARQIAGRALEDANEGTVIDTLALDDAVAVAISAAADGKKPRRQSPCKRKACTETGDES